MTIDNIRSHTDLKTSDFDYALPRELIAQSPAEPRDSCRLMVLDRGSGSIYHRGFRDIIEYFRPGDVLVINDSRVIPARIYGRKLINGIPGANVEFVLLRQLSKDRWETVARPGRRLQNGTLVSFGDGLLTARIEASTPDGDKIASFEYDSSGGENIYSLLDKIGKMPLPPYITRELDDNSEYQTVYARENGSAAAPTAGLHFTEELLGKIKDSGVYIAPVMLHVGLGTFRPVKAERIEEHIMHSEYFSVPEESARIINSARRSGGRIITCGTTSCRTLESASDEDGCVKAVSGETGIFIYPGYKFKAVDMLITNFHLPQSTLLMLVSALAGRDNVLRAYSEAVKENYRFFSFGDAMLIE